MALEYTIWLSLLLTGCALGSFAGATVWRLRARQLVEDKRAGEVVDMKEYAQLAPLAKATISSDRSRCLHCNTTLAWYDLLPLISWVSTRGRCRYCKARIGRFEPAMELGMAGAFVGSYLLWPLPFDSSGIILFILWLLSLVILVILLAYDLKWFLLPDQAMFPLIGVGVIIAVLKVIGAEDPLLALASLGGAIALLSGLYYALWLVSKGQWIGFGDIKLGLALALLLADWRLALLALFCANLFGTLVVLPGMIAGRIGRKAHIPFGPFLILGAIVAMLVGKSLVDFYTAMLF